MELLFVESQDTPLLHFRPYQRACLGAITPSNAFAKRLEKLIKRG